MPADATKVYGAAVVKDLSFVLPIIDRQWFGLTVKPSLTGERVTRVVRQMLDARGLLGDVWYQVFLGHIPWGIKPAHPVDAYLLEVAWRHS